MGRGVGRGVGRYVIHPWPPFRAHKIKNELYGMWAKTRRVSNLEFYAQSTIMVISGDFTFFPHTIIVRNIKNMLKTGIYSDFQKQS